MPLRSILALVLLLIAIAPARPATKSAASAAPALLYTVAKSYDPLAWLKGADRFSSGASIYINEGSGRRQVARRGTTVSAVLAALPALPQITGCIRSGRASTWVPRSIICR